MPYGPHTADDRARMLGALGIDSARRALRRHPAPLSAARRCACPRRSRSSSWRRRLDGARGAQPGRPRVVPRRRRLPPLEPAGGRPDFARAASGTRPTRRTSPRSSQGTLQSIYEFQSLIAELTGLRVVSASQYDGAAATAEAALMTCRETRRDRVLVVRAVHPPLSRDPPDLLRRRASKWTRFPWPRGRRGGHGGPRRARAAARRPGSAGRGRRRSASRTSLACSSRWPRSASSRMPPGRCSCRSSSRSRSRSSRRPAHTARTSRSAKASRSASPPQYGGPYLGILASADALVRQIPGRLVGLTTDADGKRAYVITLRAREQDIRRERAASNICTNQALLALAASVWLATIGPHGLRDVAAWGAARAAELEAALAAAGAPRASTAVRTSTSSPSRSPTPGASIAACSTAGSSPACPSRPSCPISRRSLMRCSCARRS